jgi:EmrB/QacA subfamily drug resistance transporter
VSAAVTGSAGAARPVGTPGDDGGPDPRRWKALAVCLVGGFMTLLDVSIVNVALPSVRAGLGASSSDLQWIVAGYALAFGLVLIPAGRIGDTHSRRAVFAIGLIVFTAASGLAGAATSPLWLSAARIVQGIGAGILIPQIAGFIQTLFRGPERGKAFGMLGAVIGISTAIGPLLGGLLVVAAGTKEGWRWVFYVNLPIGVAALFLIRALLPPGTGRRKGEGLDPVGVALLAAGTFLVLLPLVEGDQTSLSDRAWWLEGVAAVLLGCFVLWERAHRRRGGDPVLDLDLFRRRSYALGTALGTAYFAGFTSIFLVLTLYLQTGLGYDALIAGLITTPFALGSAVTATLGGRIVDRFGRAVVVAGLVLVVVGLVGVDVIVGHVDHDVGLALVGPLLVTGLGSGFVIAPNQTITLSEVSAAGGGSGAGVVQTAQRIGSAVGVAVVTAVFFSTVAQKHGDFSAALSVGIRVAIGFVVLALLVGLADLRRPRRRGRHAR